MEQKSNFLQRSISIIGAYSDLGRDTLYLVVLRNFSSCLRWRRVRTPRNVGIPIRLCVETPQGPIPPMTVPLKPFNVPPNSLAVSPQSRSGSFHPWYVHLNSVALVHSLQFFRKVTPQKQKWLNPLDSFLPHFTRFCPVEDVKLRIRDRFPIPRIN